MKYHILFRACDKIESVHNAKRPFGLSKQEVIKVSFYSLYESLRGENFTFTIIGDNLSKDLLDFFNNFKDLEIINLKLGSAANSLKYQLSLVSDIPEEDWVYLCEDDYLHTPYSFKYISEFVLNKETYTKTSRKKKNYMNYLIGNLSKLPLVIYPPDYPDRYQPPWKRLSFVFLSKYCHWRQITNTTHSFLIQSRDLKKFKKIIDRSALGPSDSVLSERLYGRIFFKKKVLCVSPIRGLSTHLTEGVMTPFVDWENISLKIIKDLKKEGLWSD